MKYVQFKNHFYKLVGKYGFVKEGKLYKYRNDEVMIIFQIDKSQYSNSVSRLDIGINPLDIMKNWNLNEPNHSDHSQINYSLINSQYIELDEMTDDKMKEIEQMFTDFFENSFSKYTSVNGLQYLINNNKLKVADYILEFWNI